ncbi:MAG: DUF4837 family protein [Chlorobi bacterium]|nr:DUF4837 family protein [Chlorobiota bacterium]
MKNILFSLIILASILTSCDSNNERILPSSTGRVGQVLVVMADHKWEQEPGKVIRKAINEDYSLLPQSEPLLDITHVPNRAYSKFLMKTRNILLTQISVNVKKPEIRISYDKHAYPQLIISIKAKNNKEFVETFKKHEEKIISSFVNAERDRLIKAYSGKLLNKKIKDQLAKNHNIYMSIPTGFNIDVDSSDFVWISRETPRSSQGILIWEYAYTDTSQFHLENMLNKRDSITKYHIPGPVDSTYMATERMVTPEFREFLLNKNYTAEIKGLWKLDGKEGVFMGGPYLSISQVDTLRDRIITVDAFAYGGKNKKRELMRQLDAILHTFKILY